MRAEQITLIGSSNDREHYTEAREIGTFIARKGRVLITGGRGGVMEAASQGAEEAGGIVIGILPGDRLDSGNNYSTVVVPTGIGFARNIINILAADIVIAVGGGPGTLSELAYSTLYQKPIICCLFAGGWGRTYAELGPEDREGSRILRAENLESVFHHLEDFFSSKSPISRRS